MEACRVLIIKGKFFAPPPEKVLGVKELFLETVRMGVGRPIGNDGFADSQWTPELLTAAISEISVNQSGVDLRTVQRWFQDNDHGISASNIHWLARIFGCDDPEASGQWQIALSAAQARLMAERRNRRKIEQSVGSKPEGISETSNFGRNDPVKKRPFSLRLALKSEALFGSGSSMNLPAYVFAGSVVLGFLAFILGVHSVTYNPVVGLAKQVGFFWAPNWTILGMVLLPLYLFFVVELLVFWKSEVRPGFIEDGEMVGGADDWESRIQMLSYLYLIVLFISVFIVFLLQWSGVHLRSLLQGDVGKFVVDWSLMAVVRPDVISVPAAILVTMLAFLYTASNTFLYLTGLLLLYTIADDLFELSEAKLLKGTCPKPVAFEASSKIMAGVYRCIVLGLLMIITMKMQAMYLLSDAESILAWLGHDVLTVWGAHSVHNHQLDYEAMAQFTTLLLLFLTIAVFLLCSFRVYRILDLASETHPKINNSEGGQKIGMSLQYLVPWWKMMFVVGVLVMSYFLIGVVVGFSIFLGVGLLLVIYSLYDPMFGRKLV
jgi:hypothetical protein